MPKPKRAQDNIEVEPGAEKRLADILMRALNTLPKRRTADKTKSLTLLWQICFRSRTAERSAAVRASLQRSGD